MTIVTPIVTKYFFAPVFRKYVEYHFARYDHISNIVLMVLVLCAFISIASYTGTSILFGAFLAGTFLTYLPSKHPDGPFIVTSREEGEREADKSPTFVHTFEAYLLGVQEYLMAPLFFASIGFAIPFVQLWTGKRIWRGVLYTLLMAFAKVSHYLGQMYIHFLTMIVHRWNMGSTMGGSRALIHQRKVRASTIPPGQRNRRYRARPFAPNRGQPQIPRNLALSSPPGFSNGSPRRNRPLDHRDRIQLDLVCQRGGLHYGCMGYSAQHDYRSYYCWRAGEVVWEAYWGGEMGIAGSDGVWAEGMTRAGLRRSACHFDGVVYSASRPWWTCFDQV